MKALCAIFKTVSAFDEFKSTIKICLRETRSLSNAHDVTTVLLVSLFLCGVCMRSVLCFVFVSDRNKLKSGFKRSYSENTFRICFQPVWEKDERIRQLIFGNAVDCRKQGEISDK